MIDKEINIAYVCNMEPCGYEKCINSPCTHTTNPQYAIDPDHGKFQEVSKDKWIQLSTVGPLKFIEKK